MKGLCNYVVCLLCTQFIGVPLDMEEKDIIVAQSNDIQILLLADKQIFDDGILHPMVNYLRESGWLPSDIVVFVHAVIDNCLRSAFQPTRRGSLSDLRVLLRPA